jgi:hypothetical protein
MMDSQALCTLKAFAVVLVVLCGTSSHIFKSYKSGVIKAYEFLQLLFFNLLCRSGMLWVTFGGEL